MRRANLRQEVGVFLCWKKGEFFFLFNDLCHLWRVFVLAKTGEIDYHCGGFAAPGKDASPRPLFE